MPHPNGSKPPNPQWDPRAHGRRPSAPKPHKNSGKGACERSIISKSFIAAVRFLDYVGLLGPKGSNA